MFEQKLYSYSQLPVRQKDRKITDFICTIIGAIFALTMFILAFVLMNKNNYYKTNFPTDSDHQPCAYGPNQNHPYIYFPDINQPSKRVCVASCPNNENSQQIQCRTNSQISDCQSINVYESSIQFERLGGFCAPNNPAANNQLIKNLNLTEKWNFLNTYDVIRISLLTALAIGIIWMVLVQLIPRLMAGFSAVAASLILLGLGILLLVDNPKGWQGKQVWKIIIPILLIIFAVIIIIMLCVYKRRIKITGVLLHYAGSFLSQKPINFLFIPIFIILTLGLIALCTFQYLAYTSNVTPTSRQDDIYLHSKINPALLILNIIQFIWGIQFLKDSFNFMISGNASNWYIQNGRKTNCCIPVHRYFCKNFGSVVGGSFLNAFFNFFNFLFQTMRCYPEGVCGACAPLCNIVSKCCCGLCDLVRNDAYAYINLTGIPYCNASRNCEALCNSSNLFIGNQSVMFFYRFCAHTVCVGLTVLFAYIMIKNRIGGINVQSLLIILLLGYCIVTYFIDIHADAAEALQISYLTELQLHGNNPDYLASDFSGLKGELRSLNKSYDDAKC